MEIRKLLDAKFYLRTNPDVAAARMEPVEHYLKYGAAEGRQPHPMFDPTHYGNSLLRLLEVGENLSSVHPLFDCAAYAAVRPGVNPFVDYVEHGSPAATEGSQFGQC